MKRLTSALLALLLCLTLLPTTVMAAEPTPKEWSGTVINPLYADVMTEEDLLTWEEAKALDAKEQPLSANEMQTYNAAVYVNKEQVVEAIRAQMVRRVSAIEIHCSSSIATTSQASELIVLAMEHGRGGKDAPKSGDSLLYEYGGWNCAMSTSGTTVTIRYAMTYYTTASQERQLDWKIEALKNQLDLTNTRTTAYEKVVAIHEWIKQKVEYGGSGYIQYTAYGAAVNGLAVCQGYSVLFYRLAMEAGIDVRVVSGWGNGGRHAWNIVQLGQKYYLLDCTWDENTNSNQYFLKGSTWFYGAGDHVPSGEEIGGNPDYTSAAFNANISTVDYQLGTGSVPGMVLTLNNSRQPVVQWTAVSGATAYEVYRSTNGTDFSIVRRSSALSFTDTSTAINTRYYYKVRAVFSSGCSSFCGARSILTQLELEEINLRIDPGTVNVQVGASVASVNSAFVSSCSRYADGVGYTLDTSGCCLTTMDSDGYFVSVGTSGKITASGKYYFRFNLVAKDGYVFPVGEKNKLSGADVSLRINGELVPYYWTISMETPYVARLYIPVPYRVTVTGGTSYVEIDDYKMPSSIAAKGDKVYLDADEAVNGTVFSKWTLTSGNATLYSYGTEGVSYFYMPNGNVSAKAVYRLTGVPTLTTGTDTASGKPVLKWTAVTAATQYEVYRSTTGASGSYKIVRRTTGLTFTDTDATAGSTYYYVVRGVRNGDTYGSFCAAKTVKCIAGLTVPTMTLSVNTAGQPVVSWSKVSGAAQYEVYRSDTGASGSYKFIHRTTAQTFTDTSAAAGSTWYYVVRAKNSTITGKFCAAKSVAAIAKPVITVTTNAATGKPVVSWGKANGAAQYEVYSSTTGAANSYKIVRRTTAQTFTDTNATAGTTYYYVVRGINGKVNGSFCAAKSVRCVAVSKLTAPTMTLSVNTAGQPVVNWSRVSGAAQYEVYRSTTGTSGSYRIVRRTTALTFTDTQVTAGSTYYYVVRAMNGSTYSAFCAAQSVRAIKLGVPSIGIGYDGYTGQPVVEWSKVSGAAQYEVYRSTTGAAGSYRIVRRTSGLSFTDTTAVAGVTYYYVVRAINGNVKGSFCAAQDIRCLLATPVMSSIQGGLNGDMGAPSLSWRAVEGAEYYAVTRSLTRDGGYTLVKITTETEYQPTEASGPAYYYKVVAWKGDLYSLDGGPLQVYAWG